MRAILTSIILCVLLSACSKPEPAALSQSGGTMPVALLESGGTLTVPELAQLAEIHPLLTNWTPFFSGVCMHAGAIRRVYVKEHGIGSTVSGSRADALVFDSHGQLVDASIFRHRFMPPRACSILSMSPLRLRFSYYGSTNLQEVTGDYQRDLAIQQFRKEMDELAAWIQTKGKQ